jgi:hypothetical protein
MQNNQKIVIAGQLFAPPEGLEVTNFLDPAVPCFKARRRAKTPVTELVIHETVTTSVNTTIEVLRRRKLGVHFIIGPNGAVTQHNDLALDRVAHAPPHNKRSVGIEVVTPYYPDYLGEGQPWKQVIDAKWAHKKRYVVPTLEQAEATSRLIDWLTSDAAIPLRIPCHWVGLKKNRMAMGRLLTGRLPKPGVWAHTYFGHADGAWLILYSWLRIEAGLDPEDAYDEAVRRATGNLRQVDLSDLITEQE